MSPARKKSKSSGKARAKRPMRPTRKPAKTSKAKATKPKTTAKAAKTTKGKPERRHCAATDPFGDPCQSAPRPGSTHCTIHSYLDR